MGLSVEKFGTITANQFITTYSSGNPNWNYIPSASKSNKTQEEFTEEITELAVKAATAQSTAEQETVSRAVLKLRTEYLSDVAPDRKGLYQAAKNEIGKQSDNNPKCHGIGELSLLDFLEQAEGRGKLANRQYFLAGGATLTCPTLSTGGSGVVIENEGVNVLSNTGHGWSYELTSAELAKKEQFYAIYWKAYRAAQDTDELSPLPDYLEEKNTFDEKA